MRFRIARPSSIQNPAATLAESCAVFIMRSRCMRSRCNLLDTGLSVEERSAIPAPYAVLIHGAQVAPPGLLELQPSPSIYVRPASALIRVVVEVCHHVLGEHLSLLRDVLLDRTPELWVPDLVRAVRKRREEAACELVLPLRAGLEELETPLDGELYRLVVAELEVQVAHLFNGAPVAAEERLAFEEVERPCDRAIRAIPGKD